MKKEWKNPYRIPVEASQASAGTAVSPGWKIVEDHGNMFFVPEDKG